MSTLEDAFAPLMEADPAAFRGKFRRMASDPHAFYRGSACLFYADVTGADDPFADDESSRIWVHGDLHVENFGTYLNSDGLLVFDVNDFDEAYLGRFTWDLQRFAASLALVGWQKALPEDDVRRLIGRYAPRLPGPGRRVRGQTRTTTSRCTSTTRTGRSTRRWSMARRMRRADLLDGGDGPRRRRPVAARGRDHPHGSASGSALSVVSAYEAYLESIPHSKRVAAGDLLRPARRGRQDRVRHRLAPGCRRTTC